NERVIAGASIETLLAVLMFVMMGIVLERSKIANDLLTTMARVFGPLPGGLAVSVVVVGAFLAASTGIVGATVVTMGLLSLPTMLRAGYSPQLATGVIAASGTLGQIIPPSIVIVLLGTMAGDLYASGQEVRAQAAGCSDALTFLGRAAVVSVGTLFQAAILPGLMLAFLYAAYAFGFAVAHPSKAPAIQLTEGNGQIVTRREATTWFLIVPVALIGGFLMLAQVNLIGSQDMTVDGFSAGGQRATLRTNVPEQCKASMIALHGQERWDAAVAEQATIAQAGGATQARALTPEERQTARVAHEASRAPIGSGVAVLFLLAALVLTTARGLAPMADHRPVWIGLAGVMLGLAVDALFIGPLMTPGESLLWLAVPFGLVIYAVWAAMPMLTQSDIVRVVFPPLVLVVAVLGSILGGITNPTPAAALGAGGALLLAAYRRLKDTERSPRIITGASFALVIMLLVGVNFDLRLGLGTTTTEQVIAFWVAMAAYSFTMFGIFYACWVLWRSYVLTSVVRETAKITSMVFAILIGSQILNLVLISFGGEHYIQSFLRSFDNELTAFLIVMLVLFILGFVLDFLEIIYIVVPIVGPVIYGGTFDPSWVTIMITVNLQTSFLTPPFGFALFYLRGVAPKEVTTRHIYTGVIPFVIIQVGALLLLYFAPWIVTIVPNLLG
ncbi:MAG: TRAP transporter large permease subunit, partial [Paracoccaceae bacterium]